MKLFQILVFLGVSWLIMGGLYTFVKLLVRPVGVHDPSLSPWQKYGAGYARGARIGATLLMIGGAALLAVGGGGWLILRLAR